MTVDPILKADLTQLEETIRANETPAIRARWDYGRKILACYLKPGQKQLAKGLLEAIAEDLGVHRSEVSARLKCAKKYPTEAELSTAVESFKSWTAIKQQALTETPRSSGRQKTPLQRAFTLVKDIDPVNCDASDLVLIEKFHESLQRLAAGIVTLHSDKAA
jgi:hypothetical protein